MLLELDAAPTRAALPAEIDFVGQDYGREMARVRFDQRAVTGGRREIIVPTLLGYGGYLTVTAAGSDGDRPLASTSSFGSSPGMDGTLIAVVGVGTRVATALSSVPDSDVHAGAAHADAATGEPVWPTSLVEWGGVHVVLAGGGAFLRAPPAARRALADFVTAGGTLVLSPRTVADLSEPTLAEMLGTVQEGTHPEGWRLDLRGERLERLPFGWVARYGLGAVIVLRRDLSLSTWTTDPLAEGDLADLVRYVAGRGGAYLPAGELGGLSTLRSENGSMMPALRPEVHLRGPLLPITILLFLYVVALGVMLQVERRRGTPMRAFTRAPLVSLGTMAVVIGIGYVARGHSDAARALVVYETASGSGRALMHTFAGITAGRARTMDLAPAAGDVLFAAAPDRGALGVERWTGDRLSAEGVRLGIWETAGLLIEGMRDLGGAVTVTRDAGGVPTVHNGTRLRLSAASLVDARRGMVWRFARPVAPGETAVASAGMRASPSDLRSLSTFGVRGNTLAGESAANTFLNTASPSLSMTEVVDRAELWALAERPAGMIDELAGIRVEPGVVLLRVVLPDPFEPGGMALPLSARTQAGNFQSNALPAAVTSPPPAPAPPAAPSAPSATGEADASTPGGVR